MPRPLCDVNGAEYQEILRAREMIRRYGADYKDALWAEDTLHRLKQKPLYETYNDKDLADFLKAREIYERLADAEQKRRGETAQNHSTPQYIWRTAGDGKVRREHAANNGKIFSWDNPPPTGNPGEAFGCRCWAEAYKPAAQETVDLQEKSIQTVSTFTPAGPFIWTNADLLYHYFYGNGQGLFLGRIGLLNGVINYARTQPQKSGGSIFDRVARKIFVESRQNQGGTSVVKFSTSYDFSGFMFSFGDSTVEGQADVTVTQNNKSLIISADIYYTFWDEYKDPIDDWDIIPFDIEIPGGKPFAIMDVWQTRLEAIIKLDSSESRFPDDEFGNLYGE